MVSEENGINGKWIDPRVCSHVHEEFPFLEVRDRDLCLIWFIIYYITLSHSKPQLKYPTPRSDYSNLNPKRLKIDPQELVNLSDGHLTNTFGLLYYGITYSYYILESFGIYEVVIKLLLSDLFIEKMVFIIGIFIILIIRVTLESILWIRVL